MGVMARRRRLQRAVRRRCRGARPRHGAPAGAPRRRACRRRRGGTRPRSRRSCAGTRRTSRSPGRASRRWCRDSGWRTRPHARRLGAPAGAPCRGRAPRHRRAMTPIDFWFDPVSPYAYLAFERLPEAFVGLSYTVAYRPIVFGALLKAFDHKGPAEIEPKRAWTFRQVHWLAHRASIAIDTPARHPFNSLGLSRLAWATAPESGTPGRFACETILRHVWRRI